MIKWLYSNTVSRGIPEHIWSPKQTDVHFANAWIQAVIDHPEKDIFVKNVGLQFLEENDFAVFKEFDVIYTHLISIRDIGQYKWHEFPKIIKEKLGSSAPKIMMAIDNEMGHIPPKPQIKEALDHADLIAAVTKLVLDKWPKYTKTPVRYIPAPKYYHQVRNPTPIEKRKKIIALIRHTWVPSDDSTGLDTQLKACAKLNYNVRIFTGWFGESATKLKRYAVERGVNPNKLETFTRLSRIEYFEKLAECWIGMEDEYIGASRFAAECASLKIPIIGTEYITGTGVANPDLITERKNVEQKIGLANKLFNNQSFYIEQGNVAHKNIKEHYDGGVCLDRLLTAWKEIGVP